MKVAHLALSLDPFGSAHVLHCLLKYRGPQFADQWVVVPRGGPAAANLSDLGCAMHIEPELSPCVDRLAGADLINAHCSSPDEVPRLLAVLEHTAAPYLFTQHGSSPAPRRLPAPSICTTRSAYEAQAECTPSELIDCGVDLDLFVPLPSPAETGRLVVRRAGHPRRCAECFWLAMADVVSRHSEVDVQIVGAYHRTTGRVQTAGAVPDLGAALGPEDICVSTPGRPEDHEAVVVMAAMAMGIPTVLTDVPAYRSLAVEGETSFFVPLGDAQALAAAIERLLHDPALRRHLGAAAAARARQRFDARDRVPRHERAYARVLNEERGTIGAGGWAKRANPLREVWLAARAVFKKKPGKGDRECFIRGGDSS